MVGKALILVDAGGFGLGGDAGGGDLVVDAPADVLGPGLAAVAPPGVGLAGMLGVEAAVDVDRAELVEQARHPGTLLGQEAGVLLVGFPVLEVDFLVGNVPVAADDDFAARLDQRLEAQEEDVEKAELGLLAFVAAGAGGLVERDDGEMAVVGLDVAAFGIEFLDAEALDDALWRLAGVDADAAVALLLGVVEGAAEAAAGHEFRPEVGGLRLEFLHADDVGMLRGEPIEKALGGGGADTVEVGRYNSHQDRFKKLRKMSDYKAEFVEFAIASNVLCFGEFKTKAGRMRPYFFNAGLFNDGDKLKQLGEFYAKAIVDSGIENDKQNRPANKNKPQAASNANTQAGMGRNVPFAFNRKEAKDHGEGGSVVGAKLQGRVL